MGPCHAHLRQGGGLLRTGPASEEEGEGEGGSGASSRQRQLQKWKIESSPDKALPPPLFRLRRPLSAAFTASAEVSSPEQDLGVEKAPEAPACQLRGELIIAGGKEERRNGGRRKGGRAQGRRVSPATCPLLALLLLQLCAPLQGLGQGLGEAHLLLPPDRRGLTL